MSKKSKSKLAVLVLSCDKYSDLWDGFFFHFWKHWSSCPYPVYLGSNTIKYIKDPRVKTILTGPEKNWSSSCRIILEQIPESNLLIISEDYFINSDIDITMVKECLQLLNKKNTHHVYWFAPMEVIRIFPSKGTFGKFQRYDPLTVHICSFWKKSAYIRLLTDVENPWQFEGYGSYRIPSSGNYHFLNKRLFSHVEMVDYGSLFPDSLVYCKKNNISL